MKFLTFFALASALTLLPLETPAQKRAADKQSAAAGRARPICQGDPIPKSQVVVGVKTSSQCSSSQELVTKRPSDSEVVCDVSPVPSGYSVSEVTSSLACNASGSNPLTNAMLIVRDGTTAVRRPAPQSTSPRNMEEEEEDNDAGSPQKRTARRRDDSKSLVEARAEEVNRRASEHLAEMEWEEKVEQAIKTHQLLIGMSEIQVLRSWGRPYKMDTSTTARGTTTSWWYETKSGLILLGFNANAILDYIGT